MTDDVTKQTGCSDLGKSVSSGKIEVRDSQGFIKPIYFQQPDVIALPTAAPQAQGGSEVVAAQSVANNNSNTPSKDE
jgi:hypothetical protein